MVQDTDARIRLARPDVGLEEAQAVADVLESGTLTMGPKVEELEAELARACGVEHAVALSSGTAALHLAVLALDLGEDDEVIVPAYTFPATANVVAVTGARPVLVDVDPHKMNLDPGKVYDAVSPRTRAVLAVHLFGRPLDWEELQNAVPPEVQLVEDAAGALGARWRGMPCGGLGVMGCLSFHPRKIVTTGEGGAVTTSSAELAERVRSMRNHGKTPAAEYDIASPGLNYRLSDILCAIGIPQVRRLRALLGRRKELAAAYAERLEGLDVLLPSAGEGDTHGWQAYVIQLERRDEALAALRAVGIEAQIGTYALHRLAAYRAQGSFPGAEAAYERALALPFHSRLAPEDLDRVVECLRPLA
ncbi:MAG: DegT/DnrJ/EryC1/StrS aminotransferase family protein [Actinobacteria bacterium]|nr:DegT/DnrJ/EryC1/StrS aminotransferase family protein [Actinomycetota bacterium]